MALVHECDRILAAEPILREKLYWTKESVAEDVGVLEGTRDSKEYSREFSWRRNSTFDRSLDSHHLRWTIWLRSALAEKSEAMVPKGGSRATSELLDTQIDW